MVSRALRRLAVPLTAFAFLLFYAIIAGAGAAYGAVGGEGTGGGVGPGSGGDVEKVLRSIEEEAVRIASDAMDFSQSLFPGTNASVLDEGRITTVDERAVYERVEVLARDQVRRAGLTVLNRWPLRP